MVAHKVFYPRLVESIIELRGGSEKANRLSSASGDADTPIPGNEAVSRANEAGNQDSSANATTTITMRTAPLPEE